MNKIKQLTAMIEEFDRDLGVWADILGGVCLVVIFFGLFVLV
ncbi:MAG: hypothetical protein ACPG4F_04610 [Paracoccaceae bacterium]